MPVCPAITYVLPGDQAAHIAVLRQAGREVAMGGEVVNDAPALARADLGWHRDWPHAGG